MVEKVGRQNVIFLNRRQLQNLRQTSPIRNQEQMLKL
jgi:hypothetical protein